jgi:uncharacterized protein (UPF0128 family)
MILSFLFRFHAHIFLYDSACTIKCGSRKKEKQKIELLSTFAPIIIQQISQKKHKNNVRT